MQFFWKGLKEDVKKFIATCLQCQQSKYDSQKLIGLLQPLRIPNATLEEIAMNFITGLPNSNGKIVILVVIDKLSKYAHFSALPR